MARVLDSDPLVIWGAGAMGGSIGADLARNGVPVVLVDTARDHVDRINEKGLTITGPVASFTTPGSAFHPDDVRGTFSTIFLCVKAHHTRDAASALLPFLATEGAVVSVQNGLCERDLVEIVGFERTVGAFVNFGADYIEPGVVHRGNRGATVVGELDGSVTTRIQEIHGLLRIFEPDAVLTGNIFDPSAFAPDESDGAANRSLDDLVVFNRASAKTHSGIWRDLAVRKRKTEVDAQLGWVVRVGEEHGIPTPLTDGVIRQIHELETGERSLSWENLYELGAAI